MQSQGTQGVKYLDVLQAECNAYILTGVCQLAQRTKTHSWSPFLLPFQPHDL